MQKGPHSRRWFWQQPIIGKEALTMHHGRRGWFRQQVRFLKRQFPRDGDLPLCDVLSEDLVERALTAIEGSWPDRTYSPPVPPWVFRGQVLSQDHSCRAAVARSIAHRVAGGQRPCSAESGGYRQARKRLPEKYFADIARESGHAGRPGRSAVAMEKSPRVRL
jgi:hypothetical protein